MLTIRRPIVPFLLLALVLVDGPQVVHARPQLTLPTAKETPANPEPVDDGLTIAGIDKELADAEANSQLDDALKGSVVESLKQAKDSLTNAANYQDATKRWKTMLQEAPLRQGQLEDSIKELAAKPLKVDENLSTTALTTKLATVNNEIATTAKRVTDLTVEPTRRRTKVAEIPDLVSKAEQAITEARTQLEQLTNGSSNDPQQRVQKIKLRATIKENLALIESLQSEQAAYTATTDELLPLERQFAEANVQQLRLQKDKLEALIADRQQQAAKETTTDMQKAVDAVPESLREDALANIELAKRIQQLVAIDEAAQTEKTNVEKVYNDVQTDLVTSEERIKAVGLTDALGLILRKQREEAVSLRARYQPRDDLTIVYDGEKFSLSDFQVNAFELEDELEGIEKELENIEVVNVDWNSTSVPWADLTREEAEWVLLRRRKDLIESTLQSQGKLLTTLVGNDTQRRRLAAEIEKFTEFVDQHLFWTRSAPAFSLEELSEAPEVVKWIGSPNGWRSAMTQMLITVSSNPLRSIVFGVLVMALLAGRSRIRRGIDKEGDQACRSNATYRATILALIGTIADAFCWPLVFLYLCFLLTKSGPGDPFVRGLGIGAGVAALYVASRELLRQVCREKGLAMAHFDWGDSFRKYLRRHLRWYTLLGSICVLAMGIFYEHPDTGTRAFATRMVATFLFCLTAVFHHIILRSNSPLHAEVVRHNPYSNLYRLRKLLWILGISVPIVFSILAMAGYMDTTFRLGRSLQSTFLLLVVVVISSGLTSRWMMLKKRDLARKKAKELRAMRIAELQDDGSPSSAAKEAGIVLHEEEMIDFGTIDQQSRQTSFVISSILAIFGLVYIWGDMLPALQVFDTEDYAITFGSGEDASRVSLLDVGIALIFVTVTIYITRVLPGLFDLLVLGKTSLDSGARYAISTLLRYALIIIGSIFVMNLLSVPYDKLGWLLAAASVGLGFGLQEIVANFVSGIILLLERPVRVGDVVTIDDTTGIVSRIQMRATTVTNWDRKELVIPNKDLITQKLLNWSLTNVVNRLTLTVGVAYGSNPNQVREILFKIVTSHPEVMEDPPPLINFDTFGDSSLNFVVRLYLEKLDNRIEITHQLNTAICNEFAKSNIEIPFPQRDVNFSFADGTEIASLARGAR
ncbi:mechanosensitive ion channel domain-containing protein [Roseiconus lacunae]|uniref:mechanosensitive ion channel domain-containing protein n=1 Tax=Roseiconus lacunae TaxID=2605694 RepID=UPI0030880910|nr:mechanosensitive ion channel domain-containing protein [Stieleria sp. HD01]